MAQGEWREQVRVEGEKLADEVKKLIHEGNVRHLIIRHEGHTIFEIPVTATVAVAILVPTLAAVAAVGALLTHCTIEVVRAEPPVL
jgi:hypothetical protein